MTKIFQMIIILKKLNYIIGRLYLEVPFNEAYIFGSVTKPYEFSENSDADIGFLGLKENMGDQSYKVDIIPLGKKVKLMDKIKNGSDFLTIPDSGN